MYLNEVALEHGILQWQLAIKFHYFFHAKDQLRYINLKYTSCYGGEAFVGMISKSAHSAAYGKASHQLTPFVADKVRLGACISFRNKL